LNGFFSQVPQKKAGRLFFPVGAAFFSSWGGFFFQLGWFLL